MSHKMSERWHRLFADQIIHKVAELPDRTFAEDWDDAMLVTRQELGDIIMEALARLEEHWTKQGMLVLPGWAIVSTEDLERLAIVMPPSPYKTSDGRTMVFKDPMAAERVNEIGSRFREMMERTTVAMEPNKGT